MSEVDWINIAIKTALARVDDREQARAVCRYLCGEVERLEALIEKYEVAYQNGMIREIELLGELRKIEEIYS